MKDKCTTITQKLCIITKNILVSFIKALFFIFFNTLTLYLLFEAYRIADKNSTVYLLFFGTNPAINIVQFSKIFIIFMFINFIALVSIYYFCKDPELLSHIVPVVILLLVFLPAIMSIGLTARHDMFGEAVTFFSIFIGSILFAFKIFDVSTITKD